MQQTYLIGVDSNDAYQKDNFHLDYSPSVCTSGLKHAIECDQTASLEDVKRSSYGIRNVLHVLLLQKEEEERPEGREEKG